MGAQALNRCVVFVAGFHGEEFVARMACQELPLLMTEYRSVCWHLESLFHLQSGRDSFTTFVPFLANQFKFQESKQEQWILQRVTVRIFQNGSACNFALVEPLEFDNSLVCASTARGHFIECGISGEHFVSGQTNLLEEETIASMNQTEAGRRKLNTLATKVMQLFGLSEGA
mmetsp:Transcript_38647/g.79257  ORF Transcript_38647/g.79257 Transcript_38647/m.79257 type:complete len:172 (-) Transcript_38647:321-836(-)